MASSAKKPAPAQKAKAPATRSAAPSPSSARKRPAPQPVQEEVDEQVDDETPPTVDDVEDPDAGDDGSGPANDGDGDAPPDDGSAPEGAEGDPEDGAPGLEMDIDLEGVDEEDLKGMLIPPGYYHAELDEVTPGVSSQKKTPFIGLRFRILNGIANVHATPIAKYVGKMITHEVYVTEKTKPTVARFAIYLGALDKKALGTTARVDWNKAPGAQVVIQVINEGDPLRARLSMNGIFKLRDPDLAVKVPLDMEAITEAGINLPAERPNSAPNAKRPERHA